MPTKAEMYAQMAEKVAVQLTGSWQEWAGFLTNAARLYKYPFHEQLMTSARTPPPAPSTTCGTTAWAGMCGAGPRASPWWTIPGTGPGCAMCLIFLIPAPVNIPAPPGCGR